MTRLTFSAVMYIVLVFLSGVLVGGFGVNLYNARSVSARRGGPPSPSEMRQKYLDEMTTRLKLRPDQIEQVKDILETTHTRFRAVREKWDPEVRLIQEQQSERIREVLDPAQKTEYEVMRQEREKMRREREKDRPPRSYSDPHAADV